MLRLTVCSIEEPVDILLNFMCTILILEMSAIPDTVVHLLLVLSSGVNNQVFHAIHFIF